MNGFDNLYGNTENIKMFSDLIAQGRLSHAYMLHGAHGSGKKTMALAIAEALAKDSSEDLRARILTERCPDVSIIRRPNDRKTMGVATIRDFISTIPLSPSDLDFKMYIIDQADTMTPQAQNALLKVLEEPPKNTYIMLLCENASSLLPTVRSRMQSVNMEHFQPNTLTEYFKAYRNEDVTSERFMFSAKLSDGAIGKTDELLKDDYMYTMYLSICQTLKMQSRKFLDTKYNDFVLHISGAYKTRDDIAVALDLFLMAYSDILVFKFCDHEDATLLTNSMAAELSERFAIESLKLAIFAVSDMQLMAKFSVNPGISSSKLAEELWNVI